MEVGKTTKDGLFTLEAVSCVGACALAPVVRVGESETLGRMTPTRRARCVVDLRRRGGRGVSSVTPRAAAVDDALRRALRPEGVVAHEGALEVRVCAGTACHASGRVAVREAIKTELALGPHRHGAHRRDGLSRLLRARPHRRDPAQGLFYPHVRPQDVAAIIEAGVQGVEGAVEKVLYRDPVTGEALAYEADIPFYKGQRRLVLALNGKIDPYSHRRLPRERRVRRSGRRRSPTTTPKRSSPRSRVRVCADAAARASPPASSGTSRARPRATTSTSSATPTRATPGAFMDRSVLEGDPHAVLEGMIDRRVRHRRTRGLRLRARRVPARRRAPRASPSARRASAASSATTSSARGFAFDVHIKRGRRRLRLRRGDRPDRLASRASAACRARGRRSRRSSGLWGKPTNINNVETFANVPWIVQARRRGLRRAWAWTTARGTKIFALAGKVANGGLVEVPMGTTLRQIIFDIGGGMPGGRPFKAVQIGGPSGGCMPAEHARHAGRLRGAGRTRARSSVPAAWSWSTTTTCMVDLARYFLQFTQDESCGKCVPCRLGTKRMLETLHRITAGDGREGDIELLEELSAYVIEGSLCALGGTAPNPVLTTLRYFRDEYRGAHQREALPGRSLQGAHHVLHRRRGLHRLHALRPQVPDLVHRRREEAAARHRHERLHQVRHLPAGVQVRRGQGAGPAASRRRRSPATASRRSWPPPPTRPCAVSPAPTGIVVTIDDQDVVCSPGETVLEAARRVGIHIPTLCYEPRLPASGACRLCIVEVEGARKVMTSCTTAVASGHGRAHQHRQGARHAPSVPRAAPQQPQLVLHAAVSRRLPDAHQDPAVPRLRRAQGLQERRAQAARGPAFPGHPRARLPAALRRTVSPPAGRPVHHDLPAPPLHGRPVPRRGAGGRAAAAGRAQAGFRQAHRDRGRRAVWPRRRLLRPARGACGHDLRGDAQAGRHVALRHPELPSAARGPRQGDQRPVAHGRRAAGRTAGSASTTSSRTCSRTTTPSSWPWAPAAATTWASPARTRTASSPPPVFLGDLERDGDVHVGERVVVIGGGFTAMDACRTAVRRGAREVTCLYRRSRKEMPAHHSEVDEAEEEGVKLELLCAPVRIITDRRHRHAASKVTGIEMQRMELGEPDASGPPPSGARGGLRVHRRVRSDHRRHRPVPRSRRHQRGAGREAHQVAHHQGGRLDLSDRRPARLRRRRRGARRADRDPGGGAGQEGGLEHRRLPARRRHGGRVGAARACSRRRRSSTR